MLFTNIQLDDFAGTLARFLERLEMEGEGVEEREWVMMGVVNLGAVLEYGRASSVVRCAGGFGMKEGTNLGSAGVKVVVKRATTIIEDEETKMDIDDGSDLRLAAAVLPSLATSAADEAVLKIADQYPAPFKLAAQLAFSMLSHVLKNPTPKASPFARSTLNPYLTIVLTFLATLSKHPASLAVLERSIPWDELAKFFAKKRRQGTRWAGNAMEVDEEDVVDDSSEESEDYEDDSVEVKKLKVNVRPMSRNRTN
jgi:hypothetical protein